MKSNKTTSQKHLDVKQNNKRITIATVSAASLFIIMVVGGHSMINRMGYQRRVTSKQNDAIATLKADQDALNALVNQYKVFNSANPNMLGVSNSGTSGDEGSNARIVLDALPSQYDFPALTSSIEKILLARGIVPEGISGSDTSTTVAPASASASPQSQPIQFTFSTTTSYQNSQSLLSDFQRSIRPFKVLSVNLSASGNNVVSINATMETYYQPGKTLGIKDMVIK